VAASGYAACREKGVHSHGRTKRLDALKDEQESSKRQRPGKRDESSKATRCLRKTGKRHEAARYSESNTQPDALKKPGTGRSRSEMICPMGFWLTRKGLVRNGRPAFPPLTKRRVQLALRTLRVDLRRETFPFRSVYEGAAVELEHTPDVLVATKIALDHLRELPDYYTGAFGAWRQHDSDCKPL
jgi:hypothetical protein